MKTSICLLLVILVCEGYSRKLPSYLDPCHRDNPKLSECILKNVEIIRPKLKNGIPELQVPSFNPLVIPEATLTGGQNFKATFSNIQIFMADEFVVHKLDANLDKFRLGIDITFPHLRILSHYKVNGRILILQLNGEGEADGNYTNVRANLQVNGDYVKKNNKNFIKINDDRKIDLIIGKPHFKFDRIFGDNVELNEQTNKIINENSEDLIKELTPVVTDIVGQFVFHLVNRIFDIFEYDSLFPA